MNDWLRGVMPAPAPLFLRADGTVEAEQGVRDGAPVVLSRALVRYKWLALPADLTGRRRAAAIALKAAELSPFDDTGSYWHGEADGAALWFWDKARITDLLLAAGMAAEGRRILPETVMRERGGDGFRLATGLDGVEGQWWRAGQLRASRWWPETPASAEWISFQRSAGVPPQSAEAGAPVPLALNPTPWRQASAIPALADLEQLRPSQAAAGVLILFGLALAWQAGGFAGNLARLSVKDRQISALEKASAPVLADRTAALDALDRARKLAGLDPFPAQLALMSQIAGQIPRNGTALNEWDWQAGQLAVGLSAPQALDASGFIRSLEALPGISGVKADGQTGDRMLRLKMVVDPAAGN